MSDDKPKHKPQQKHTLSEVLKSLQDLIRTDLIPAKTPPPPPGTAPPATPAPSAAEADSFNEALNQLDQIITQRIIEPVERAREQPPEPLLPDETLEIEWNDGVALEGGETEETPAPSAEPEIELESIEETIELQPVSADAESLSEQNLGAIDQASESPLADIAPEETLESIIAEASRPQPPNTDTDALSEQNIGAIGDLSQVEVADIEVDNVEKDVAQSDTSPPTVGLADIAEPPADTEGQEEFNFTEPMPEMSQPALVRSEDEPVQETPTLTLAPEPVPAAPDKTQEPDVVPDNAGAASEAANDSISIDLSEETPPTEPQPDARPQERDSYVVEFESPRAAVAPSAPPVMQVKPGTGDASNLLEESPVNMKSPPKGFAPPNRPRPDEGAEPPERAKHEAANATKDQAEMSAPASAEHDAIPILKEVANLAAPPAPPLPDAAQARDIAIRVIAKLNIERRKAGEPQLDIKTIERLQQYLADALTKRALNKPK